MSKLRTGKQIKAALDAKADREQPNDVFATDAMCCNPYCISTELRNRMTRLSSPGPIAAFSYVTGYVPSQYHCGECGKHGLKLWRNCTFLYHQSLLCGDCACEEQNSKVKKFTVTEGSGKRLGRITVTVLHQPDPNMLSGDSGDQIGWRIPAVPTEDGAAFWNYMEFSIGLGGSEEWWNRLPLRLERVG